MIILARPVAYGGNAARYAMEKENATVVKVNHMPDYLDATEIWYLIEPPSIFGHQLHFRSGGYHHVCIPRELHQCLFEVLLLCGFV